MYSIFGDYIVIDDKKLKIASGNVFTGYTNLKWPEQNNKLVVYSTNNNFRSWPPTGHVDINILNTETLETLKIGSSTAWNWQLGSHAHFLDRRFIAYNIHNTQYLSINIFDLNAMTNMNYDDKFKGMALLATSPTSDIIIRGNIEFINKYRPDYGYFPNIIIETKTAFIIHKLNGELLASFSFDEIQNHIGVAYEKRKVNHFNISSDGKYVSFLYRGFIENERFCSLFRLCLLSFNLELIIKHAFVSHYEYFRHGYLMYGKLLGEKGIHFVSDNDHLLVESTKTDYHICVIDENLVCLDSYPNKYSRSKIRLVQISDDLSLMDIASLNFMGNARYRGPVRVDHHVKYIKSTGSIIFDCEENVRRSVCELKLSDFISRGALEAE